MVESGKRVIKAGCEATRKTRAHVCLRRTAKERRRDRRHRDDHTLVSMSRNLANLKHAENLSLE
jgi:hypothetical protein